METENKPTEEEQPENKAGSSDRVEEVRQAFVGSAQGVLARAKPVLLSPHEAWSSIKANPESMESFYKTYLAYLVPIPPVCGFVGMAIVSGAPFFASLVIMILSLIVGFAMPYIAAVIYEKVAPMCDGQVARTEGVRLFGYAATPAYLAGVFSLIPVFGLLGSLISLYAIYLFYLGVPVMTSVPQKQVIKFMAISFVALIIVALIIGMIQGMLAVGSIAGGTAVGF